MSNPNKENDLNESSLSTISRISHHGEERQHRHVNVPVQKLTSTSTSTSTSMSKSKPKPKHSKSKQKSKQSHSSNDDGPLVGGSDAASSYFFSKEPKTPAVKKELKRRLRMQQQQQKSARKIASVLGSRDGGNGEFKLFNSPTTPTIPTTTTGQDHTTPIHAGTPMGMGMSTGMSTGMGMGINGEDVTSNTADLMLLMEESDDNNNDNDDNDDESILLSPSNTTMTSTTSSASGVDGGDDDGDDGGDGDVDMSLNRSVLSDTTELTASNYVFAAASRHRLLEAEAATATSIAKLVEEQRQKKKKKLELELEAEAVEANYNKIVGNKNTNTNMDMNINGTHGQNYKDEDEVEDDAGMSLSMNRSIDTLDISKLLNASNDNNDHQGDDGDNDVDDVDDDNDEKSTNKYDDPSEKPNFSCEDNIEGHSISGADTGTADSSGAGNGGDDTMDTAMMDQLFDMDDDDNSTEDLRRDSIQSTNSSINLNTNQDQNEDEDVYSIGSINENNGNQNSANNDVSTVDEAKDQTEAEDQAEDQTEAEDQIEAEDQTEVGAKKSDALDTSPEGTPVVKSFSIYTEDKVVENENEYEHDLEENTSTVEDKAAAADDIDINTNVKDAEVTLRHASSSTSSHRGNVSLIETNGTATATAARNINMLPFGSSFISSSPYLNLPLSSRRRNRRFSSTPGVGEGGSEGQDSAFKKGARGAKKFTASIKKARQYRESIKKKKTQGQGFLVSLPHRFDDSPSVTAPVQAPQHHGEKENQSAEKKTLTVQENSDTTVDFGQHKINDILSDLVVNDGNYEHAIPETLNMSILQDSADSDSKSGANSDSDSSVGTASPESNRSMTATSIISSRDAKTENSTDDANNFDSNLDNRSEVSALSHMPPKSPLLQNRIKLSSKADRVYVPSPGRHTRSVVKKRKSLGWETSFESIPSVKRSDRKATPQKKSPSGSVEESGSDIPRMTTLSFNTSSSIPSPMEDDTQMMMEYLVPNAHNCKDVESSTNQPANSGTPKLHLEMNGDSCTDLNLSFASSTCSDEIQRIAEQPITVDSSAAACQVMIRQKDVSPSSKSSTIEPGSSKSAIGHITITSPCSGEKNGGSFEVEEEIGPSATSSTARLGLTSPGDISDSSSSVATNILLGGNSSSGAEKISRSSSKSSPVLDGIICVPENGPSEPSSDTFSSALNISSPLSEDGIGANTELFPPDSPSSSTSSEMSSSHISGDNGDTANSLDLREIMADLGDELGSAIKDQRAKKRRRSSKLFQTSISSSSLSDTEDSTKKNGDLEVATANTQDLKGLLSSLESRTQSLGRQSTLLPIKEDMLNDTKEKNINDNVRPTTESPQPQRRELAKAQTPKSILKKRGRETPKRNVVFYPPVAAEYNVGSPATNFTPMSSVKTNNLFKIPRKENEIELIDTAKAESISIAGDHSFEIDTNINNLISKITKSGSSVHSPSISIGGKNSVTGDNGKNTVNLDPDLLGLLNDVAGESSKTDESSLLYESSMSMNESAQFSLRNASAESCTMELEADLMGMLSCVASSKQPTSVVPGVANTKNTQNISDTYDSLNSEIDEISNDTSISVLNSSHTGKFKGDTVALDIDMKEVIGKIDQDLDDTKKVHQNNMRRDESVNSEIDEISYDTSISASNSSRTGMFEGDTVALDINMKEMVGKIDQDFKSDDHQNNPQNSLNSETDEICTDDSISAVKNSVAHLKDMVGKIGQGHKSSYFENEHQSNPRRDDSLDSAIGEISNDTSISISNNSMSRSLDGDTVALEADMMVMVGKIGQEFKTDGDTNIHQKFNRNNNFLDAEKCEIGNSIRTSTTNNSVKRALDGDMVGLMDQNLNSNADYTTDESKTIPIDKSSSCTHDLEPEMRNLIQEVNPTLDHSLGLLTSMSTRKSIDSFSTTSPLMATGNKEGGETQTLEPNLEKMLCQVDSTTGKQQSVSDSKVYEEAMSFGDASVLQSDSITEDFRMLGETNRAAIQMGSKSAEDSTISLGDASILQKTEGDTEELEADVKGLLGKMNVEGDFKNLSTSQSQDKDSRAIRAAGDSFISSGIQNASKSSLDLLSSTKSDSDISSVGVSENIMTSMNKLAKEDSSCAPSTSLDIDISSISSISGGHESRRTSLAPSSDISSTVKYMFQESESERSSSDEVATQLNNLLNEESKADSRAESTEEAINLKWEEVKFDTLANKDPPSSVLAKEAANVLVLFNHPSLRDEVNSLLDKACEEMECNGQEDIDPDVLLIDQMFDESTSIDIELLNLQKALRGDYGELSSANHCEKLKILWSAVHETINTDVANWESLILGVLQETIGNLVDKVDGDQEEIQRQIKRSVEIQENLSIISHQAVRKAKIQSFQQKEDDKKEIEETIRQLEADLAKANLKLQQKVCEHNEVQELGQMTEELSALESKASGNRLLAESILDEVRSIEGTANWKLLCVEETRISVEFVGSVSELTLCIDFIEIESGLVACNAYDSPENMKRTLGKYKKNSKFSCSVLSFFSDKVRAFREDLKKRTLKSTSDISTTVRHIEWFLGRLDIIGKEISMLESRYSGKLQRNPDNISSYQFELLLTSKSKSKVVKALVEIGESYPFAALEIDLSGDIPINDALKRHLVKNAKPGFGYVSRVCDVLASFLQINE